MTKHFSTNWPHKTHDSWTKHILERQMDVMGVLKFNNGRYIALSEADELWTKYWRKMDRIFFGHATHNGFGIERACFTEYGADGRNIHLHFAARAPITADVFCAVANAVWVNLDRRTAPYSTNHITPFLDPEQGAKYTCKSTTFSDSDETGARQTRINESVQATLNFNLEAQITRIGNALTLAELNKAYSWIDPHLEKARQRAKARQAKHKGVGIGDYQALVAEYYLRNHH